MPPLFSSAPGRHHRHKRSRITTLSAWIGAAILISSATWYGFNMHSDLATYNDEAFIHDIHHHHQQHTEQQASTTTTISSATTTSTITTNSPQCSKKLRLAGIPDHLSAESVAKTIHQPTEHRRLLYNRLDASLLEKGLEQSEEGTQNMSLGEMFKRKGGKFEPILHKLDVPVRAIVMPLRDQQAQQQLTHAVKEFLFPLFEPGVVYLSGEEESKPLHSTIYHASSHFNPIPANLTELHDELEAIQSVASSSCAVHAVLERIVITGPSGTVMACWQVAHGIEPKELREKLKAALPNASAKQVVQDYMILHTTLARLVPPFTLSAQLQEQRRQRLLGNRKALENVGEEQDSNIAHLVKEAADAMTERLCGLETVMNKLWFVEEVDKLALGLGGEFYTHDLPLKDCKHVQHGQRENDIDAETGSLV